MKKIFFALATATTLGLMACGDNNTENGTGGSIDSAVSPQDNPSDNSNNTITPADTANYNSQQLDSSALKKDAPGAGNSTGSGNTPDDQKAK